MSKPRALWWAGPGIALGLLLFPQASTLLRTPVIFQSAESVTGDGGAVFNQVKWIPGWTRDVWMMRQSHHGYDGDTRSWDRLAIVVDKTVRPYRAAFYQFAPGEEWVAPGISGPGLTSHAPAAPYRARCYACHVTGPRAIRPAPESAVIQMSWLDQVHVLLWNLRIKTYGVALSEPGQAPTGANPFRSRHPILRRPLGLKSCIRCHSPDGIRGELRLEHAGTARFLVEQGIMPPFPFRASAEDRALLNRLAQR
jgi:hypothetical protein